MSRIREMPFTSILICSDGQLPIEIQLLPFGSVKSKKGTFLVDQESIQAIIANAKDFINDFVIDYEHQTLYGKEAPAAGWIKELINKGEEGIWARVEWTTRAEQYLANKEYRYLSPVVMVRNKDKRAVAFHSAALTNTPAIDGMIPIANKSGDSPEEEKELELLQKIIALLGLSEDATAEEVIAAVSNMKESTSTVVANKEVLQLLGLPESAPQDHITGKIIALKDKTGYVSKQEFETLQARLNERERDEVVTVALKAGKISPAQKEWAEQYALKDPEGFKSFVAAQPQVVPVETEIASNNFKTEVKLDDTQLSINKMLGVASEAFNKEWGEK